MSRARGPSSALAAALLATIFAGPARAGEEPAAPPATTDHVRLEAAGRELSGWPLAPQADRGYVLLGDDGAIAVLPRDPAPRMLEVEARPVAEVPSAALVAGLSNADEWARDACEELLSRQGAAALPFLGGEDLLERCVDALQWDGSALVRHQAIVRLGRCVDLRAVDPLLAHLEGCEERSLRIITFDALRRLTGRNFGRDEQRWRNWWSNHRSELLPDKTR
jgi:hypothetical protein